MATGLPFQVVLDNPALMAMFGHFFDRRPPGDAIVRVLVARIGMMLENFMSDPNAPPRPMTPEDIRRYQSWFFWEKHEDLLQIEREAQDEIADVWGPAYQKLLGETVGPPN